LIFWFYHFGLFWTLWFKNLTISIFIFNIVFVSSLSDIGLFQFRDERSTAYPFVVTSMMSKGFEMVLLAVSQKWPVLLYGPPGAGKTALINKLAQDAGNQGT
jgi:putative ribosome biogenesis GTPase RsgA